MVTASGSACITAETLASGRWTSARRKLTVPPASASARRATSGCSTRCGAASAPRRQASTAISAEAKTPRTSMTCAMFIEAEACLVMASLKAKPTIATTM